MSKIHVFKTEHDDLVVLDEERPTQIWNDKIPPSELEEVYSFEAISIREYAEAMIPLLFQRLKEDKGIAKVVEQLMKAEKWPEYDGD